MQSSTHSQYLMSKVFEDEAWIDKYVTVIQRRLTKAYNAIIDALQSIDVPVLKSQGSLMLWANFRQYLPEDSWAGENQLWEELFTECKWLITKGQ